MRKRKNYRLPPQPLQSFGTGIPTELIVRFLDTTGTPVAVMDLSAHAGRARMAADFVYALRWHLAGKSKAYQESVQYQFNHWFRYLDACDPERTMFMAASDIDRSLLQAYAHWLGQQSLSRNTRASLCSTIRICLTWLKRNRPDLVQADLELPRNLYPYKDREARPRLALRRAELDDLLTACKSDINASWADFQRGQDLIAQGRHAVVGDVQPADLDLKDLRVLLAYIVQCHGGLIPKKPMRDASGRRSWLMSEAVQRHGGNVRIGRLLHATPDSLAPYMIAIAAQTFANPEALRCFRRDCLSEHVFLEGRSLVTWAKGRSSNVQRRSFLRSRAHSVPNLIDRVLAMTAPLIPHCPPADRDKLFLAAGVLTDRRVRLMPSSAVVAQVRRFVERYDLRTIVGTPLDITLATLRATGLTLAHSALGNDVIKTQALANHASHDQTRHYIDQPMTHAEQAMTLSRLQGRFIEAVRGGSISGAIEPAGNGSANQNPDIDSLDATASGFRCADPLAGVAPGQRKGHLCTAWLACFTCPNAVVPLDAETLARLLRMREALTEARGRMALDRWTLLYAPKLEILERDVLPRFPADLHVAANAQLDLVPPTAPIE